MPYVWTPPPDAPVSIPPDQVKKVAIIGGGPSGAITLDSLVAENRFEKIVLFERRHTYGGVWVYDESPPPTTPSIFHSTSLDPPLASPFGSDVSESPLSTPASDQERFEITAAYETMPTNIIEKVMTFSDQRQWIPNQDTKYVDRPYVQKYVNEYILKHKDNPSVTLTLDTHVEDVVKIPRDVGDSGLIPYGFRVTTRQKMPDGTDQWRQEDFDSVVVTSGHHHIPWVPRIPGSIEAVKAFPDRFEHSKYYRNGKKYRNKRVIVVGSRISGCDISRSASDHGAHVYQVVRSMQNSYTVMKRAGVDLKPEIDRFEVSDEGLKVIFVDGSEVLNPDKIVFATGYRFSFPFLHREYGELSEDGVMVPNLYEHTFFVGEPLINFVGMPVEAISFRVFEFQAILVARFIAGRAQLPSTAEQEKWVRDRLKERGFTRGYHTVGIDHAAAYMNGLAKLGEQNGQGRQFPFMSDEDVQEYAEESMKLFASWE